MKKLIILLSLLAVTTLHAQYKSVMVDTNGTLAGPTNFWTTNASQIRTTLNLGSAATNPATAFQPAATILSNLVWSGLTNTNSTNFLTDLGLYTTNSQALPDSKIWVGRVNSMGYQAMVTTNPLPYTANAAIALDGYHGLSFPAVATRDSLSAISRTNLGIGMSWITNTNTPVFYTVYTITETPEVRYGTNVRINTPDNFDFGGVGGTLQVEASDGNHAIAAKASDITDGAAFYGWSQSGAPAAKFVQTNHFDSPALTVWRTTNGNDALSPAVLISGSPASATNKALSIRNGNSETFWVKYDGTTSIPVNTNVIATTANAVARPLASYWLWAEEMQSYNGSGTGAPEWIGATPPGNLVTPFGRGPRVVNAPDGANTRGISPIPSGWPAACSVKVRVFFALAPTASTTNAFRIGVYAKWTTNADILTPVQTQAGNVFESGSGSQATVPGTGTNGEYFCVTNTVTFATNANADNRSIFLERAGTHANDTSTNTIYFIGAHIELQ